MKKNLCIIAALLFCFVVPVIAVAAPAVGTAVATWDAPKTRVDGSAFDPTKEVTAYNMYYGLTTPPATKIAIPIGAGFPALATGITYTVTGLTPGKQYYFDVTAVDQYGQESAVSNIVVKSTPLPAAPGAPTMTSVVLAFLGMVLAFVLNILLV